MQLTTRPGHRRPAEQQYTITRQCHVGEALYEPAAVVTAADIGDEALARLLAVGAAERVAEGAYSPPATDEEV